MAIARSGSHRVIPTLGIGNNHRTTVDRNAGGMSGANPNGVANTGMAVAVAAIGIATIELT